MKRILREEVSRLYRKETIEGFGILAIGLAAFGLLIWAIGRIVRGFLGIPRGMDKRPN